MGRHKGCCVNKKIVAGNPGLVHGFSVERKRLLEWIGDWSKYLDDEQGMGGWILGVGLNDDVREEDRSEDSVSCEERDEEDGGNVDQDSGDEEGVDELMEAVEEWGLGNEYRNEEEIEEEDEEEEWLLPSSP